MYENKKESEKLILIGVSVGDTYKNGKICPDDTNESLEELAELVATAGAETVGKLIQNREAPDRATYFGKGKIEELRQMIEELKADGIVSDDELSPSQLSNLEEALDVKVLDRTQVILDIFALRAATKEGKIQVETAQLKYRQSHLIGARSNLSRLGGGIGTRGPGEKKLEVDRRLIRDRISALTEELKNVEKERDVQRAQRMKANVPVVAIVGYTNAGKSTLLNTSTGAAVLEEDKLFATLDPTVREYRLASGQKILLSDTVGFVRKLPHNLVNAFRSTLEETKYADIIVQVVDASNPDHEKHMEVTYDTLFELGITGKPFITFFNKCDRPETEHAVLRDLKADHIVRGSAKTGEGLDELFSEIDRVIKSRRVQIEKLIPYSEAGTLSKIRKNGVILSEEYEADGIRICALVNREFSTENR